MQLQQDEANLPKIVRWVFVIIWMTLIFCLSAQPADESDALSGQTIRMVAKLVMPGFADLPQIQQENIVSSWQHTARKTAHGLAYFVLGSLCMAAMLQHELQMMPSAIIALGISIAYAVSDEVHQLFVVGRSSQLSDMGIDACGALMGILLVFILHRFKPLCHEGKKG
ncbi:MAG: VanZ family protein [Syntrophomonadaceae bacterium]|nr:VanZ family protein [Syntrophomonadaceae bacterium]